MTNDNERDILAEAIARLKSETPSEQAPKAVVDETLRRLADPGPTDVGRERPGRISFRMRVIRLSLAAAALIALGVAIGRMSGPASVNMDELREVLAPSIAASIEPAIRAGLVEDMRQRYQVALAAAYVKVKEELTEQYRDDLNRMAVQMLAASNAVTNRLLTELVKSIDTAQTQDLTRIARALYQIDQNRIDDKTQLATGLHMLASRTENTAYELSQTRREFAQMIVDVRPEDFDAQPAPPMKVPNERNEP